MNKSTIVKAALAATTVLTMASASATEIIGTLNMNPLFRVQVVENNIDWNPPSNLPFTAAASYGNFGWDVGGNTGVFAGGSFVAPAGTSGNAIGGLHDLSNDPTKTGNYFPVGSNFLSKVVKFDNEPNWVFDAYYLAPGYQIVPGVYLPYSLTELGSNLFANITINGIACDDLNTNGVCDAGDDKSNFTLALSAQYTNLSIADAITALTTGSKSLPNNSWSGVLTATKLPEPGSIALVGLALAGLGFAGRRRQAK